MIIRAGRAGLLVVLATAGWASSPSRMAYATPALSSSADQGRRAYQMAWVDCTMHEAVRLAASRATIDRIIEAVYASCSEEERLFTLALIRELGATGFATMNKIKREVGHRHLTLVIVKARKAAPPARFRK
jgi:hypothetical protein